ncbi:hypothetical protein [Dickeya sp. NCPPB 3274]|uniref:hypothetical protein n=1 Tax=Dickeya sp. NCPPB 3274 TaxID=568766 RepID=UPI0005B4B744|nr:hypothetical protein [Dickeya sp. NCPPB 3274]
MQKLNKNAVKKTMLDLFKILIFLFITLVLLLVSYIYRDTILYTIYPIAIPIIILVIITMFLYKNNLEKIIKEEKTKEIKNKKRF